MCVYRSQVLRADSPCQVRRIERGGGGKGARKGAIEPARGFKTERNLLVVCCVAWARSFCRSRERKDAGESERWRHDRCGQVARKDAPGHSPFRSSLFLILCCSLFPHTRSSRSSNLRGDSNRTVRDRKLTVSIAFRRIWLDIFSYSCSYISSKNSSIIFPHADQQSDSLCCSINRKIRADVSGTTFPYQCTTYLARRGSLRLRQWNRMNEMPLILANWNDSASFNFPADISWALTLQNGYDTVQPSTNNCSEFLKVKRPS